MKIIISCYLISILLTKALASCLPTKDTFVDEWNRAKSIFYGIALKDTIINKEYDSKRYPFIKTKFRIKEIYKGEIDSVIYVYARGTTVDGWFEVGREYIVFACNLKKEWKIAMPKDDILKSALCNCICGPTIIEENFDDSLFIIMRQMKEKKFRKELHKKLKKGEYRIKYEIEKKLDEEMKMLKEELIELEKSKKDSL